MCFLPLRATFMVSQLKPSGLRSRANLSGSVQTPNLWALLLPMPHSACHTYFLFLISQQLPSSKPLAALPTVGFPQSQTCRGLLERLLRLHFCVVSSSPISYLWTPASLAALDCDVHYLSLANAQYSLVTPNFCNVVGKLSWNRNLGNCGTYVLSATTVVCCLQFIV